MEELNNLIGRMEEAGMSVAEIRARLKQLQVSNPELFQESQVQMPQFQAQPQTFSNTKQPDSYDSIVNDTRLQLLGRFRAPVTKLKEEEYHDKIETPEKLIEYYDQKIDANPMHQLVGGFASLITGGNYDSYLDDVKSAAIRSDVQNAMYETFGGENFESMLSEMGLGNGFDTEDVDPEKLRKFIVAAQAMEMVPESEEYLAWEKSVGEGLVENLKKGYTPNKAKLLALMTASMPGNNFSGMTSAAIKSMAQMFASSSIKAGLGAVGTVAAGTAATTGGAGLPSLIVTAPVAYFAASGMAMENAMTFSQLVKEQLQEKDLEFTSDNVMSVLDNEEDQRRITNIALGRGMAIGAIEGIFSLVGAKGAGSVFSKVASKAGTSFTGRLASGAAAGTVGGASEFVGGALGEAAGMTIEGKALDMQELWVEGFAGFGTAPVTTTAGVVSTMLKPPKYTIGKQEYSRDKIKEMLNDWSDKDVYLSKLEIKNDPVLQEEVNKRKQKFVIENQLDKDITNKADRARIVELEMEIKKLEGSKTNFDKQKLSDLKAEQKELMDKYTESDIARAEVFADKLGVDVFSGSQAEVDAFVDKFNKDNNLTDNKKYSSDGLGSIITDQNGKDTIIINKDAARQTQRFTTGQHEILHAILKKSLKNNDAITIKLGQELKSYLDKMSTKDLYLKDGKGNFIRDKNGQKIANSDFINRFNQYAKKVKEGTYSEAALFEEVFTLASEAMTNGDLTFEQSTFDKIIDLFKQFYKQVFGGELVIDNAKDMFNFIKEYNKDFKAGRVQEKYKGKLTFGKNLKERAKNIVLKAQETTEQKSLAPDVDPFEQYRLDPKERKETVNRLYEEGGLSNLEGIIKPFLPIAKDLVKSRQRFDNVGRQEREDLINEYTAATIEKLIQHINAYDPSKNKDFDAYVNSYVEFKRGTAAKKLQTKETKLTESQERKAKKKVDDTVEEVDTPPISSKITLETETQEKFKTNVENLVVQATKLISLGKSPKQIQKFLQGKFRNQNIAKDIKNTIKDKKVYKKFLEDNFETFFNDVNVETLNKRFRGDKNNPDLFSKSTDKRYQRSDTSQPYQFVKQPWSQVKDQYLDYFLNDTPQNVNNRKDKIVEEISNYMSFEAAQEITQSLNFTVDKDIIELSELKVDEIIDKTKAATNVRQRFSLTPDQLTILNKPENRKPVKEILGQYSVGKNGISTRRWYENNKLNVLGKIKNKKTRDIIEKFVNEAEYILEKSKFSRFTVYMKAKFIGENEGVMDVIGKSFAAKNETDQKQIARKTLELFKTFSPAFLKKLGFGAQGGRVSISSFIRFGLTTRGMNVEGSPWVKDNKYAKELVEGAQKHLNKENVKLDDIESHKELQIDTDWNFLKHAIYKGSKLEKEIRGVLESNSKNKINEIPWDAIKKHNKNAYKVIVIHNLKLAELLKNAHNIKNKEDKAQAKADITRMQQATTGAIDSIFKGSVIVDFIEIIEGKKQFTGKESRLYIEHLQENAKSLVEFDKINDQYMRGKINQNTYITKALKIAKQMTISINDSKNTVYMDNISKVIDTKMKNGQDVKNAGMMKLGAIPPNKRKNFINVTTRKNLNDTLAETMEINALAINKQSFSLDIEKFKNYDKALEMARRKNPPKKGASFIDFDDTLATSDSKIIVNNKPQIVGGKQYGYETWADGRVKMTSEATTKITPAEFAKDAANFESIGATFDFSEFNKVIKGKKGPFFNKARALKDKFGNSDIYIITARPAESALAIQRFLKGVGLDIKLENIRGLEDGRPEAKAEVIVEMAALGYNDFLFADDAIQNVKAVQKVLDVLDVKGKTYQVEQKFSLDMDKKFNEILEENKGIDANARFSEAMAKVRGAKSDKFWSRLFVPPGAEDFMGMVYMMIGKGKKGERQKAFFKKALADPFARAVTKMNNAKQAIENDYIALNKEYKSIKKKLLKATDYNNFTFDQAIRVYLMDKNGIEIPGISKRDTKALIDIVKKDPKMVEYADGVSKITGLEEGYTTPKDLSWLANTIESDLRNINIEVNRKKYLNQWIENKNIIFSKNNLNKIEALYGTSFVEALKDMLTRMETGYNRKLSKNGLVNGFQDWVNNSVGAVMFFNRRSALLQTISFANFINWSDNNPLKFGARVLDFPQFAKDFAMIFNSDMLKQRRKGLQTDVSAADIVNQAANSKNKATAMISYMLKKGFIFTQIADSFAISLGGAPFYRNRYNTYIKQGLSKVDAKEKAFEDFQETSEVAQQSARPDLISMQQASTLGRTILAWQNTPMQYTRIMKKAFLDLVNRRGDAKTHISKIIYYGAIQNFIFTAMQSALFALAFSDEEEEKEKQKYYRVANSMADTILRGTGFYGAVASTIKNVGLEFIKQDKKGWKADHTYTLIQALGISPPVSTKARKAYDATQTWKYQKKEIMENGFGLDNPGYEAVANLTTAATNIPIDRVIRDVNNAKAVLDNNNAAWQRIAIAFGWNTWNVGVGVDDIKKEKEKKKKKNTTGILIFD